MFNWPRSQHFEPLLSPKIFVDSCFWLQNFIYTLCSTTTLLLVLVKIFVLLAHRKKFLKLLLYSQKNFWHSNYDWYEGRVVANCKRTCSYLICIFCFFAQGTAINYAVVPILGTLMNLNLQQTKRLSITNYKLQ